MMPTDHERRLAILGEREKQAAKAKAKTDAARRQPRKSDTPPLRKLPQAQG